MLERQAKKIRLLILDVDGVMTDGSIQFDGEGRELKTFYVWDGLGIRLLREIAGIPTAIVSGRGSTATEARARDLGVEELHLKVRDKGVVVDGILKKYGLKPEQLCSMGDDIVDLPMFARSGLSIAPSNAHPEAKRAAHYVTKAAGGKGAVREAVELLFKSRGEWKKVLSRYRT